jgi:heptosyltransferase I
MAGQRAGADVLPQEAVREVCFVLLSGVGDAVHGLPVVNAMKRAYPHWRITWVVEPVPAGIASPHPAVDEVIVYRRRDGIRGVADLYRQMRGRRFDLTLNLLHLAKSAWPTLFSRAPRRVGFGPDRSREGVWLTVNEKLPARRRRHTQDMYLEFLDHLGINAGELEWRIPITDAEREAQRAFFAPLEGRPVVAVVPASALPSKDWLAERYARVVDALQMDLGFQVILVGGPGERETRIARSIATLARSEPIWAMGDGLRRLIWLLDGSQLVIAPDTGPLHVSRALDVPVIGLYGHTNPWRVGPYRRFEDLWIDHYTEAGTDPDPGHCDPRHGRMERITVDEVLARVERAVGRYLAGGARGDLDTYPGSSEGQFRP